MDYSRPSRHLLLGEWMVAGKSGRIRRPENLRAQRLRRLEVCHEDTALRIDAVHRDCSLHAKCQICHPARICVQDESAMPAPRTKDEIRQKVRLAESGLQGLYAPACDLAWNLKILLNFFTNHRSPEVREHSRMRFLTFSDSAVRA